MFQIDERITTTSLFLGQWPLSSVFLKNDQNIPWFILVPRKAEAEEIYHLNSEEQKILIQEINQLTLIIKNHYQPRKINVASLGNIVQQLHIHCVGRTEEDPLWPQGIWQVNYQPTPYPKELLKTTLPQLELLIQRQNKCFK